MKRLLALSMIVALALVAAAGALAKDHGKGHAKGQAAAQPSFTFGDAAILGPVHVRGAVAKVHVRYSCDVGTHLWVSAKQSATGALDPAIAGDGSGFGGIAATWWQSHRGSFTCDGARHVAWFSVDTVEPGSRGQLRSGWAWVQFCITTEDDLDAVQMAWHRVVVNRH